MERLEGEVSRRAFLAGLGIALSCAARRERGVAASAPRTAPLVYDERGGLFVEARVDGRGPVRLILDTGASRSTLSSAFAAELGLALGAGGTVEGSAGTVTARSARARVEVLGLEPLEIDAAVYDFGSYDPRCVGILGSELLSRAPFRLDYRGRVLVWDAPAPGETVELALEHGIPRIEALVQGEPLDLRLDTGAAFPPGDDAYVNLTQDQAEFLDLVGTPHAVFTATGTGSEVLELPVHRLDALEVAGVALERAFAIVQPRVGYFAREDAVGFLGNSVLDKLDPFVDYAGRRFAAGRSDR